MKSIWMAALLLLICWSLPAQAQVWPRGVNAPEPPVEGMVIIFENGRLSRPIARNTGSYMSHCAIYLDGWVYESTSPVARKLPWDEYKKFIYTRKQIVRRLRIHYLIPATPFTKKELKKMKEYAMGQMGRPYRMRNWWQDRDSEGTHCSQFAGEVLEASGRPELQNPKSWKESPITIYNKPIWKHNQKQTNCRRCR